MAELAQVDELSEEQRSELDTIEKTTPDLERQIRAAAVALEEEEREQKTRETNEPDAETRERLELRSKARLGDYLEAALGGRLISGPSAEYAAAVGVTNGIPVELFSHPEPRVERRADAVTPSPGSNEGVNVAPIFPAIFARAILPRLGVAMPQVGSGAFATMTINTSLTAASQAKGAAQESTAAALGTRSTTAHRVAARLSIAVEDVATIGTDSFEPMLRQNLSLALADKLDELGLTGDPSSRASDPHGLFTQLANPTDPASVVDFDGFVTAAADGIDGGPWSETLRDIRLLVNADVMKLAERTFQSTSGSKGETSAAAYLRAQTAGFMASSRMPDTASNIAGCIRHRAGTTGLDGVNAMQTATCPVWSTLSIDDIYSDAASGIRHFTIAALIGDVLINHANAYERVDLKTA